MPTASPQTHTHRVSPRSTKQPASAASTSSSARPQGRELAELVRTISKQLWGADRAVDLIGGSGRFLRVLEQASKVANFQEPVLITGESGVGKESLAQAIVLLGANNRRAFVTVNCPQYQEGNLTVSELFGHKRGSFTGATEDRKGCFETAHGGTIFLDEIGDLHMSAQVMLLRALATGEFQPLGSDAKRRVNVRVIAATNQDPESLRVGQHFRNDLFFRLRYFLLELPPLRERGDDWLELLDYLLAKLQRRHGVKKAFSQESLRIMSDHHWPGNIRELNSVATMGYALCDSHLIEPKDFVSLLSDSSPAQSDRVDELFYRLSNGTDEFWPVPYEMFMNRDLNRAQMRALVRRGLREADGSYKRLLEVFQIPSSDYQRFMDFLRHHCLKP